MLLPNRFFTGDGVQFFLGVLALPLILLSFLVLVRPDKAFLTPRLLRTALLSCLFTALIGIALLLAVQGIGQRQLQHFTNYGPSKPGAIVTITTWVIGWLYDGAFNPDVGVFHRILGFIFGVGLCEEFTKILPVVLFSGIFKKSSIPGDDGELGLAKQMIVVGIFSGLGFGLGEALLRYSPTSGNYFYGSLVARWFSCIPGHAIWTGIVALILWINRDDLRKKSTTGKEIVFMILLITMASGLLHGIYDLICGVWILGILMDAACIGILLILVRKYAEAGKGSTGDLPAPFQNIESKLWANPLKIAGVATAYLIALMCLGAFGDTVGFETGAAGEKRSISIGGGQKITLVHVPGGTFMMGSPQEESGRGPEEIQHKVTLTNPFWLARTEVTQGQWQAVMGTNPSHFKGDPNLPVDSVNWSDAKEFCRKLNAQAALPVGWQWALPTEAQWEYACRAGTGGVYAGKLEKMAWYKGNSGGKTHPVATKKPNAWGLYDMYGNAWEWCNDLLEQYPSDAVTDPIGTDPASRRINRGGSFDSESIFCRSAARMADVPDVRYPIIGFRVAAIPDEIAESIERGEEWGRFTSGLRAETLKRQNSGDGYQVMCPDCNGKGVKRMGFEPSNPFVEDNRPIDTCGKCRGTGKILIR